MNRNYRKRGLAMKLPVLRDGQFLAPSVLRLGWPRCHDQPVRGEDRSS